VQHHTCMNSFLAKADKKNDGYSNGRFQESVLQ
jgi:hypothetical protein